MQTCKVWKHIINISYVARERSFSHADDAGVYSVYLFIVPAGCCRPTTSANVHKNNKKSKHDEIET